MEQHYVSTNMTYKDKTYDLVVGGYRNKIKNGSRFVIGGEYSKVIITLHQHLNWLQKLMWKWCFGVNVEDYSEE